MGLESQQHYNIYQRISQSIFRTWIRPVPNIRCVIIPFRPSNTILNTDPSTPSQPNYAYYAHRVHTNQFLFFFSQPLLSLFPCAGVATAPISLLSAPA